MAKKKENKEVCSFCGRPMPNMFSGMDGSLICCECIEAGHMLVAKMPKQTDKDDAFANEPLPTPRAIKEFLDQYVIGQETAKRFYNFITFISVGKILHILFWYTGV